MTDFAPIHDAGQASSPVVSALPIHGAGSALKASADAALAIARQIHTATDYGASLAKFEDVASKANDLIRQALLIRQAARARVAEIKSEKGRVAA